MLNMIRQIAWRKVVYCLIGIAALVGLGMLMGLVARKDKAQVCTAMKVMVLGKETFIDQHDISRLIQTRFGRVVGATVGSIPTQKIEKALLDLPYVSSAEVFTDIHGVLQVMVQQREVILRVINKVGREYYVDTKGAKVPVTLKYVPNVLVANGNINEGYQQALDTIQTDMVKDLVKIVEHVQDDALWQNQIVQLYVNENDDIEIVPRVGNEQLILGDADSLAQKLDRLVVYYKNILPKVGADAYQKVNVKYGGQIICERRGDWMIDSLQMKLKVR